MAEAAAPRPSGWTVDTLLEYTNARVAGVVDQILAQGKMLDERYATQTKATEAARLTQETAMQTALTAAKVLSDAAAKAQATAIDKAEVANDKRFASLAEKLDVDNKAQEERRSDMEQRLMAQLSQQTSRLDVNKGKEVGTSDTTAEARLDNAEKRLDRAQRLSILVVVVAIIAIALPPFLAAIGR